MRSTPRRPRWSAHPGRGSPGTHLRSPRWPPRPRRWRCGRPPGTSGPGHPATGTCTARRRGGGTGTPRRPRRGSGPARTPGTWRCPRCRACALARRRGGWPKDAVAGRVDLSHRREVCAAGVTQVALRLLDARALRGMGSHGSISIRPQSAMPTTCRRWLEMFLNRQPLPLTGRSGPCFHCRESSEKHTRPSGRKRGVMDAGRSIFATHRRASAGGRSARALLAAIVLGAFIAVLVPAFASARGAISTLPEGTVAGSLDAGGTHTCGIRTTGVVACWGDNTYTQSTPPSGTFTEVSAGLRHTCGIRTDGTVACWGDNSFGQSTPPAGTFTEVSAGTYHACGVGTAGTVACWGYNGAGQSTPPGGTFTEVSAGGYHTCAVRTAGIVACWGLNASGQTSPPAGTFDTRAVTAGYGHTCGIRTDGTVACWGSNSDGQSAPPSGTFTAVSAGNFHTCGIKTDGTVACWGYNGDGESTPPAGTFTAVSAGNFHTCGIGTDGTVACWGYNGHGQLNAPPGTFTEVSAGGGHTCGMKTNGTMACWGSNSAGQLGAAPRFTSLPPPGGVLGQAYRHIYANSWLPTGTYKLSSGAFPPGLVLNSSTGVLSGTPTRAGTYTGAVTASSEFFPPAATQPFSITVLTYRTVSISDTDVREGDSGATPALFSVSISAPVPSGQTVSVHVATANGTATAGTDYTGLSTTLARTPGKPMTKTVTVPVTGDTRKETNETFMVNLSTPVNTVVADSSATGTILDDDGLFHVAVADTAVVEGNSGTTSAKFAVTLSKGPVTGQSVSLHVATANGTATAGTDYTSLSTTLTWNPGDPVTKTVAVPVTGDTAVEPNETFSLNLSLPSPSAVLIISDR